MRVRSSSRCSTTVSRSSCATGLMRDIAASATVVGDLLALRTVLGRLLRRLDLPGVLRLLVVPAQRAAELADPPAEGTAQLRQALGAKDDQRDDQDDRKL